LRRLLFWPLLGGKCPACGERFTVPLRRQLIAVIPFVLTVWFQGAIANSVADRLLSIAAISIAALLHTFWGPLVKKREGEFW
jgi:hypothetical protein